MNSESSTHQTDCPLRVVIGGGGTGGHISPAIAVAAELRKRGPIELFWIGSHTGFEREAAREHNIPFFAVRTGKLRRYLARETLVDIVRVPVGVFEARRILKRIKPDVILSTGGFASTPSVVAGRLLGIPSLTHEQTAGVGLATRVNARFADVVALSFEGSNSLRTWRGTRIIVTGNPVRPAILNGDPGTLHSLYDIPDDVPLLYVTGGAQGAHALNTTIATALPNLLDLAVVIHQCGPQSGNGDYQRLIEQRERLDQTLRLRYFPVERVGDELAHIYSAATLVIARSGAGTVAELATLGLPSILVPLPGAEEQRRNAQVLAEAGAAVLVEQSEMTAERLIDAVGDLLADAARLAAMRRGALSVAPEDPAAALGDEVMRLAQPGGVVSAV